MHSSKKMKHADSLTPNVPMLLPAVIGENEAGNKDDIIS